MINQKAFVGALFLLVAEAAAGFFGGPGVRQRSEMNAAILDSVAAVDEIQAALEEEDKDGRRSAIETSVRNGLLHPAGLVRLEVESFLGHLTDREDFCGLGHIALECQELYGTSREDPHCAGWFFDDVQLSNLDISARTDYYQRAITDGAVNLWFGSTLWRFSAMLKAVGDGISELEPLILEHYPTLNESQKNLLPIEGIHATLELRKGAVNRDEACLLGAKRLNGESSLKTLMSLESDSGFRAAVFGLVSESCSGACGREACDLLRETARDLQNTARDFSKEQEPTASEGEPNSREELVRQLLISTYPE